MDTTRHFDLGDVAPTRCSIPRGYLCNGPVTGADVGSCGVASDEPVRIGVLIHIGWVEHVTTHDIVLPIRELGHVTSCDGDWVGQ